MNVINKFYIFYDERTFREKLFLVPLAFVFWYFVYTVIAMYWIDSARVEVNKQYADLKAKLDVTNRQLAVLKQLKTSSLYKEWTEQEAILKAVQQKYRQYISNANNSQLIVKMLLDSKDNTNIVAIKNEVSRPYSLPDKLIQNKNLYESPYVVSLIAGYEEFYRYLSKIEVILKNVRWDKVSYTVDNYPVAKVEVEFSVLYEKV